MTKPELPICEKLRGYDGWAVGPKGARDAADLIRVLYEALREARVYVPDHHGPIAYKCDAAIRRAEGKQEDRGETDEPR